MEKLLSINNALYFLGLVSLTIIFSIASRLVLQTDELYYQSYTEQLTTEQIKHIIVQSNSSIWQYLGYLFIPIVVIVRVLYTSFCLQAGNLIQEYHWKWKEIYNISLKADIIYLFSLIGNFYFYAFFQPTKTLKDLSINFLSLLKLRGIENVQSWLILAFNSINLFELLYIILLILLIKANFQFSCLKSAIFVLLTYVIGNYLYIVAMTFVYLNFV